MNSSLIHGEVSRKDVTAVKAPVTELAAELGNVRAANVLMTGVLISTIPLVSMEAACLSLEEYFRPKGEKMIAFNKKALQMGYERSKIPEVTL